MGSNIVIGEDMRRFWAWATPILTEAIRIKPNIPNVDWVFIL